ncbi:MAG: V-type ATPase subunit [Candidatus Bathyarchaeia archaeon]
MLSSVYKYGELSPRARGKKSRLLVKSDYDAMLGAESVQAILRRLEGTPYAPYVSSAALGELDILKVEHSLMKSYEADLNFFVSRLKDNNAINFLGEFSNSIRRRCIAQIVKSIILEIPWEKASNFIHPYRDIDAAACKSLVESKNVKPVLKLLGDGILEAKIWDLVKEIVNPVRQALEVEQTIIKYTSIMEWEKARGLKGRDRQCTELLGVTFDMVNIMVVLRMKKMGFKPSDIEEYFIPALHRVTEKELKKAAAAATEKDSLKVFTSGYYINVISPLLGAYEINEDLSIFEVAFKRYHANECGRVFFQRFFHLTEILAYLYMKLYEVRDLMAIIVAKHLGLPSEKAERQLVLHQPPHPL